MVRALRDLEAARTVRNVLSCSTCCTSMPRRSASTFTTSRPAEVKRTNTRPEDDRTDGLATFKITVDLCRLL